MIQQRMYGRGTGPIWLGGLGCRGYEVSLAECSSSAWGVHGCGGYSDNVGVSIHCDNCKCRHICLLFIVCCNDNEQGY